MSRPIPPDHLGDGVYVTDEGHSVAIRVGDHRTAPCVHLDRSIITALSRYADRCELARHSDGLATPRDTELRP